MSEKSRRENLSPEPWEVLGIAPNATKQEINDAYKRLAKKKGNGLSEEEYDNVYRAWTEMADRAKEPESEGIGVEIGKKVDRGIKVAGEMVERAEEKFEDLTQRINEADIPGTIKKHKGKLIFSGVVLGALTLAALAAAAKKGGETHALDTPTSPRHSKTFDLEDSGHKRSEHKSVTIVKKKHIAPSHTIATPKTRHTSAPIPEPKIEPNVESKAEPEFKPEPVAEAEPKQEIIDKGLESEVLDIFHFFIKDCKVQSEGNGNFVVDLGERGCYRVEPFYVGKIEEIKKGFLARKEMMRTEYNLRLEEIKKKETVLLKGHKGVYGAPIRPNVSAIKANAEEAVKRLQAETTKALEQLKQEAEKEIFENAIREHGEISKDQVNDAIEKAKEMQKKADEQREKIPIIKQMKPDKPKSYDSSTSKQKRGYSTSRANSKYNPRNK